MQCLPSSILQISLSVMTRLELESYKEKCLKKKNKTYWRSYIQFPVKLGMWCCINFRICVRLYIELSTFNESKQVCQEHHQIPNYRMHNKVCSPIMTSYKYNNREKTKKNTELTVGPALSKIKYIYIYIYIYIYSDDIPKNPDSLKTNKIYILDNRLISWF